MAPRVRLGSQGLEVSKQGLGCMGFGPSQSEAEVVHLIHKAVDSGITFLDTADVYGNEHLIGKAVQGIRDKVQLATKFAMNFDGGVLSIRGDPAYVRAACENSLKKLGTSYIDLYYQHRIDTTVPIEITIGEMKKLVTEGKVKYLGLSEASAVDIRRAHAVHPITAVQIEWSLWSREVEEEIIPTCRELGIGIVTYSPLGGGFFSGLKAENFPEGDLRKAFPRFLDENMKHNMSIFQKFSSVAAKKGCTPGQLALAWVQCQGNDVVPIPGTTKLKNLQQNVGSLDVYLTKQDMVEVENVISSVKGERYNDMLMSSTWKVASSPPLSSYKPRSRL